MHINLLYKLLFILLFSVSEISFACNGGCPSGGGYLGIVPQFSKNFVGVRYRMRSFSNSSLAHGAESPATQHSFQTAELWGRFYPTKRIQAFVFLPFQMNTEKMGDKTNYVESVGDMSFIFHYNLINTGDSLDRDWKHTLLLGIGTKLPTGKYQQRNAEKQMYPVAFQPGTGAYSAIFSGMYTIRYEKIGLNANASYYYNGKNELDYSFGNSFAGSASLFYWLKAGAVSILPNVGTYNETVQRDIDNGYYVNGTNGSLGYASFGTDVYVDRLAFSLNAQTRYFQNLPQRKQTNDLRLMGSVTILF